MGRLTQGLAAAALVFVVLITACGGSQRTASTTSPRSVSNPASTASNKAAPSTASTASTGAGVPAKGATGNPNASAERPSCSPTQFLSPTRGSGGAVHIWVKPGLVVGWRCKGLQPGLWCSTDWSGSYSGADAKNYLRFVAWEHGKPKPVTQIDVGPLPLEGQFNNESTRFLYKVGNTDKVRFYLQLLNSQKVVVATSDTFVYNVRCRN